MAQQQEQDQGRQPQLLLILMLSLARRNLPYALTCAPLVWMTGHASEWALWSAFAGGWAQRALLRSCRAWSGRTVRRFELWLLESCGSCISSWLQQ